MPRLVSSAIDNIQVSNAFHAKAPAKPIKNLMINHDVSPSKIGNVKYKITVTNWAIIIERESPYLWIITGVTLTNKIVAIGWAITLIPICVLL